MKATNYNKQDREFLGNGFKYGFDIGYRGPVNRQSKAKNIPLTPGVGDKFELWDKVMNEVELGRVVGPYVVPPYDNFIQSPVGLVPKDGGQKMRLIFHLSYDFSDEEPSVNSCIPKDLCKVKYKDFDYAIRMCVAMAEKLGIYNNHSYYASQFSGLFLAKNRCDFSILLAACIQKSKILAIDVCTTPNN